jgi:transcriptional regulator with XRE-family HTH domain
VDRLQEMREALGLSRPELAAVSGVARQTIEGVEVGARRPTPSTVARIEAGLLNAALDRLVAAEDVIESVPPLEPGRR